MPAPSTEPVYPELAAAIARTGRSLADVSHDVDCGSQYLGQIIRGHRIPSAALRRRLAVALETPEEILFAGHNEVTAAVQRLIAAAVDQGHPEHVADDVAIARVAALVGGPHDVAA